MAGTEVAARNQSKSLEAVAKELDPDGEVVHLVTSVQKPVTITIAGVSRRVKAQKLTAAEQKELGRVYAQGVEPDAEGMIDETYTYLLEVRDGRAVCPKVVWDHYNRQGAGDTHGLVPVDADTPDGGDSGA